MGEAPDSHRGCVCESYSPCLHDPAWMCSDSPTDIATEHDAVYNGAKQDDRGGQWRVQAVSVAPASFQNRKSLPKAWQGLRDEQLSETAEIPNCVFVHASGETPASLLQPLPSLLLTFTSNEASPMCTTCKLAAPPAVVLLVSPKQSYGGTNVSIACAGFIGGAKTYEGALKMAQSGLRLP